MLRATLRSARRTNPCCGSIRPAQPRSARPFPAPRQTCLSRTTPRHFSHFPALALPAISTLVAKYKVSAPRCRAVAPIPTPACSAAASYASISLPCVLLNSVSLEVFAPPPIGLIQIKSRDSYPDTGGQYFRKEMELAPYSTDWIILP